jgi:hypothetical protein
MQKRSVFRERLDKLLAQRWSREALLAAILTIAALIFMATAMIGNGAPTPDRSSVETARTPQQ